MAKATQVGRNLSDNTATNGPALTEAEKKAAIVEKRNATRREQFEPEELELIEQEKALAAQIKAAATETERKPLRDAQRIVTRRRKGFAFVRRFGTVVLLCEELVERLDTLAGPGYVSTDAQRSKGAAYINGTIASALNRFTAIKDSDDDAADTNEKKLTAIRMAANLLS